MRLDLGAGIPTLSPGTKTRYEEVTSWNDPPCWLEVPIGASGLAAGAKTVAIYFVPTRLAKGAEDIVGKHATLSVTHYKQSVIPVLRIGKMELCRLLQSDEARCYRALVCHHEQHGTKPRTEH
jgi:hypothetical protein